MTPTKNQIFKEGERYLVAKEIKSYIKIHGHLPEPHKLQYKKQFKKYFGNDYNLVLQYLGIHKTEQDFKREMIGKSMLKYIDEHGSIPTMTEFVSRPNTPSHSYIYKVFGNYQKLLEYCGFSRTKILKVRRANVKKPRSISVLTVASVLDFKKTPPKTDLFSGIDFLDNEFGAVNITHSKCYDYKYKTAPFWRFNVANRFMTDVYILLGLSPSKDSVEHVWAIPCDKITKTSILIYSSPHKLQEYAEYEQDHTSYNAAYQTLLQKM